MKKLLLAACLMAGLSQFSGVADAATVVNLDHSSAYTKAGTPQTNDYTMFKSEVKGEKAQRINVGYLVTGDESMLLDDETMGYIRRMLNTKFPSGYYPPNRLESTFSSLQLGRRNNGEQYNLKEARDIRSKEFETLENMYKIIPERTIKDNSHVSGHKYGLDLDFGWTGARAINPDIAIGGSAGSTIGGSVYNYDRDRDIVENYDSLGEPNTYRFMDHLSTLPKEEYVKMARELKAKGKYAYDYLLLFNIHGINQEIHKKFLGKTMWNDLSISFRAIDVNTGEYICRDEVIKRGFSSSSRFNSPSWRRGMRRAIVDGLIECFDNIPIGKYSVCDSDYCERRQRERREEYVFGKGHRHCVQHCNEVDVSSCYFHMVDYAKDADLPSKYVDYNHNHID